jgi:hypothetical protein
VFVLAAVLLSAAPAFARLEIRDIQACDGRFGPERKALDYAPGDVVRYRFLLTGFDTGRGGRVAGEMTITLAGPGGETLLNQVAPVDGLPPLGGLTIPGSASITLPEHMPAGAYTMGVSVREKGASGGASFRRSLTVRPPGFAAVRPEFFHDPDGKVAAPAGGMVGQTLFVRVRAVGFDKSAGRIDTLMTLQLFDKAGNPLMPKPLEYHESTNDPEVAREAQSVDFDANFTLSRPGPFLMRITLRDLIGGKTASYEAPIRVVNP